MALSCFMRLSLDRLFWNHTYERTRRGEFKYPAWRRGGGRVLQSLLIMRWFWELALHRRERRYIKRTASPNWIWQSFLTNSESNLYYSHVETGFLCQLLPDVPCRLGRSGESGFQRFQLFGLDGRPRSPALSSPGRAAVYSWSNGRKGN